jgi:hypothetical protein
MTETLDVHGPKASHTDVPRIDVKARSAGDRSARIEIVAARETVQ